MDLTYLRAHPQVIPRLVEHQRIRVSPLSRDRATAGQSQLWTLDDGTHLFAKTRTAAPPGFFTTEAAGLRWLAECPGLPVPEVIAALHELLVLQWIQPGEPTRSGARRLGELLARLHSFGEAPAFGAPKGHGVPETGYVGVLPLDNTPAKEWSEFFLERRCLPYLRQARDLGIVDSELCGELETLLARLPQHAGQSERPCRIHGDLWSGNVHYDAEGQPWIVDAAAAHWGHRETDLATLQLFGAPFLADTLNSYQAVYPLGEGWQQRVGIHQLHLLLVHVVVFGASYVEQALRAARTLR